MFDPRPVARCRCDEHAGLPRAGPTPRRSSDGVRRIAVLGDPWSPAWPSWSRRRCGVVEALLNADAAGRRAWRMNFGISASAPAQELALYRGLIRRFAPDVVVLTFFYGNDLSDTLYEISDRYSWNVPRSTPAPCARALTPKALVWCGGSPGAGRMDPSPHWHPPASRSKRWWKIRELLAERTRPPAGRRSAGGSRRRLAFSPSFRLSPSFARDVRADVPPVVLNILSARDLPDPEALLPTGRACSRTSSTSDVQSGDTRLCEGLLAVHVARHGFVEATGSSAAHWRGSAT